MGTPAFADDYRAGEFFSLDLSTAVLSPKRLGPPAEFAPMAVEARTDSKQVIAEPKTDPQRTVRTTRITRPAHVERSAHGERQARVEKPRTPARAKLARRHGNPLDAQAMDRSIQTWPCRSGGICDWKR
ncbi:MAG: hypothetical protein GY844_30645 [Bradyrhizobium sp.]|nr:hypothetical protein [Bradyrhizobium sp.]